MRVLGLTENKCKASQEIEVSFVSSQPSDFLSKPPVMKIASENYCRECDKWRADSSAPNVSKYLIPTKLLDPKLLCTLVLKNFTSLSKEFQWLENVKNGLYYDRKFRQSERPGRIPTRKIILA